MENRINQIVELENGKQYFVLKQAVYNNENYFITAEVSEDGEDLNEKFNILHETKNEDQSYIEFEKDPKIIQILMKHLNIKEG